MTITTKSTQTKWNHVENDSQCTTATSRIRPFYSHLLSTVISHSLKQYDTIHIGMVDASLLHIPLLFSLLPIPFSLPPSSPHPLPFLSLLPFPLLSFLPLPLLSHSLPLLPLSLPHFPLPLPASTSPPSPLLYNRCIADVQTECNQTSSI